MTLTPWIGVDLDGTLAHHAKGDNVDGVGAPIPAMLERVKTWLAEGKEVRIFTARVWAPAWVADDYYGARRREEAAQQREMIEDWCLEHIGRVLPITCEKDYAMVELWDDRAVAVERNTGAFRRW